jgi:hypothetical protein
MRVARSCSFHYACSERALRPYVLHKRRSGCPLVSTKSSELALAALTCRYCAVVAKVACPSDLCNKGSGAPRSSACIACECRSQCGLTGRRRPATSAARRTSLRTLDRSKARPVREGNSGASTSASERYAHCSFHRPGGTGSVRTRLPFPRTAHLNSAYRLRKSRQHNPQTSDTRIPVK